MEEEIAPVLEAGQEAVVTEQDVTEDGADQEGSEEKKSERAVKREREKEVKRRLFRERDEAVKQLSEIRDREERLKKAIEADVPPSKADFPDDLHFAAASGGWYAKRGLKEDGLRETEADRTKANERLQQIEAEENAIIVEAWSDQVTDARRRYADFDAVALNPKLPMPETVARMVATSENGADLAYHLGKNPSLAADIALTAQHNLAEAARKIGRIEATLSAPKPRTETNAPPPISPVRGPARATVSPDKMSYKDFVRHRENGGTVS